jgi:tRNA/tmRNA/rRNA uracil-C5-methylase (TrmA/RlmC/RlmD family)
LNKLDNGNLILRAGNAVYGGLTVSRRAARGCTNEHPVKTALVKGAIPGELVEISVNGEKRSHITGDVIKVLEPSPDRIEPRCTYFGTCGGCHLQFAEYKQQIRIKESALHDCMQRIAKIDIRLSEALSIESNDWGYRHRGRFKVSGQIIGFSREKSNNLIAIEQCPLMATDINNALSVLRQLIAGEPQIFKNIGEICLVSNSTSEFWQENVAVSFLGKPNMNGIRSGSCVDGVNSNKTGVRASSANRSNNMNDGKATISAKNISKLESALSEYGFKRVVFPGCETHKNKLQNQNSEHDYDFELPLNGTPYGLPYELRYKVSPDGFFQANWNLNLKMLGKIIDSLKPLENKAILDIF